MRGLLNAGGSKYGVSWCVIEKRSEGRRKDNTGRVWHAAIIKGRGQEGRGFYRIPEPFRNELMAVG